MGFRKDSSTRKYLLMEKKKKEFGASGLANRNKRSARMLEFAALYMPQAACKNSVLLLVLYITYNFHPESQLYQLFSLPSTLFFPLELSKTPVSLVLEITLFLFSLA